MEKEIIGYKVLDKDLKSPYQKFQYEIGKIYEIKEAPENGERGFHYYNNINTAISFIIAGMHKLFKVRILGDIDDDDFCGATNKIEILGEVYLNDKYIFNARTGINLDYALDNIHNIDQSAKILLICLGYGLDVLISDPDYMVRITVAIMGHRLDTLINDPDWRVRKTVVNMEYGLDILINDPDWQVRRAVAEQEYGLDILINDPDWHVRAYASAALAVRNTN